MGYRNMSQSLPANFVRIVQPLWNECPPEGKKWAVIEIDFTQIQPIVLASSSPYLELPEITITDNSADGPGEDNSLDGYQQIEFSLSALNNGASISQCVCVKFHWRPTWGTPPFSPQPTEQPGDFAYSAGDVSALILSNVNLNDVISIPSNDGGNASWGDVNWFSDGCVPFFAGPNDTIRILRLLEVAQSPIQQSSGKLTLIFSNFMMPSYVYQSIATGDNN
jgi:hypothetical protein